MEENFPYELSKEGLAKSLAELLADTVTLHYLAHGYHWNVKGPEFSQFHDFFAEIYEDFAESEDAMAENIRKLGYDAPFLLHHFSELTIVEARIVGGDPIQMSAVLYEGNLAILNRLNDAFNIANAINAQGIANFLAERIDMVEKWLWQLGTTIGVDATMIQTLNIDMGKSKAEVPLLAVDNDNNITIAELQPTPESIRASLTAAGHLVPEEQDLAEALVEIADKYGKFNEDQTGIWADYHPASDNPLAEMGVKCGNCVLYRGGKECAVVAFDVESDAYCRFAVIPDGVVDPSKAPVTAAASEPCPPATQDIALNLENRQKAIDTAAYGPLNPKDLNSEFWQDKADRWNVDVAEAKKSVCGNCVFFIRTPKMLDCISNGLEAGDSGKENAWDAIDQAELGYCEAFDFKCAASRTCNAWAVGGPITDDSKPSVTATAGSKPAPKKDQIKGSDKNKKGSAAGGRKVQFSKKVESSLEEKVAQHNKSVTSASRKVSLSQLKAVYRRGAGAFSSSHRPDQNRNSWAMARVNAFLHLLKSGKPSNPKYTTDNDLLTKGHPKSGIQAGAGLNAAALAERDLYIELKDESEYADPEEAIFAFAEFSGLGYESIPTFRAAWKRGVNASESPFDRAASLAINLYDSEDADLLPNPEED
jgi:starvation-inducible DNA-binding protein